MAQGKPLESSLTHLSLTPQSQSDSQYHIDFEPPLLPLSSKSQSLLLWYGHTSLTGLPSSPVTSLYLFPLPAMLFFKKIKINTHKLGFCHFLKVSLNFILSRLVLTTLSKQHGNNHHPWDYPIPLAIFSITTWCIYNCVFCKNISFRRADTLLILFTVVSVTSVQNSDRQTWSGHLNI